MVITLAIKLKLKLNLLSKYYAGTLEELNN